MKVYIILGLLNLLLFIVNLLLAGTRGSVRDKNSFVSGMALSAAIFCLLEIIKLIL